MGLVFDAIQYLLDAGRQFWELTGNSSQIELVRYHSFGNYILD